VGSITALLDCFLAPIVAGTADVKVCASPVCGEWMACRMRSGEAAAIASAAAFLSNVTGGAGTLVMAGV
jgi:hypothetical protein